MLFVAIFLVTKFAFTFPAALCMRKRRFAIGLMFFGLPECGLILSTILTRDWTDEVGAVIYSIMSVLAWAAAMYGGWAIKVTEQ